MVIAKLRSRCKKGIHGRMRELGQTSFTSDWPQDRNLKMTCLRYLMTTSRCPSFNDGSSKDMSPDRNGWIGSTSGSSAVPFWRCASSWPFVDAGWSMDRCLEEERCLSRPAPSVEWERLLPDCCLFCQQNVSLYFFLRWCSFLQPLFLPRALKLRSFKPLNLH